MNTPHVRSSDEYIHAEFDAAKVNPRNITVILEAEHILALESAPPFRKLGHKALNSSMENPLHVAAGFVLSSVVLLAAFKVYEAKHY